MRCPQHSPAPPPTIPPTSPWSWPAPPCRLSILRLLQAQGDSGPFPSCIFVICPTLLFSSCLVSCFNWQAGLLRKAIFQGSATVHAHLFYTGKAPCPTKKYLQAHLSYPNMHSASHHIPCPKSQPFQEASRTNIQCTFEALRLSAPSSPSQKEALTLRPHQESSMLHQFTFSWTSTLTIAVEV